jgi:hypothetical protein
METLLSEFNSPTNVGFLQVLQLRINQNIKNKSTVRIHFLILKK